MRPADPPLDGLGTQRNCLVCLDESVELISTTEKDES